MPEIRFGLVLCTSAPLHLWKEMLCFFPNDFKSTIQHNITNCSIILNGGFEVVRKEAQHFLPDTLRLTDVSSSQSTFEEGTSQKSNSTSLVPLAVHETDLNFTH
jgi:hypothetical protein